MAFQCLYLQLLQARVWICLFHKKISAFLVFTEIIFAVRNPLDCFCSSTELTAQKHTLQVTSTARLNWTASDHPFHHDQRALPTRLRTPPRGGRRRAARRPAAAGESRRCAWGRPGRRAACPPGSARCECGGCGRVWGARSRRCRSL